MTTATEPAAADTLFSGAALVESTAAAYDARIDVIQDRLAAYSPEIISPRACRDETRDCARRVAGARAYLAGEYDRTYGGASCPPYSDLQGWREHYADDALRAALHHLIWAEHFAGLTDRETARTSDPWAR